MRRLVLILTCALAAAANAQDEPPVDAAPPAGDPPPTAAEPDTPPPPDPSRAIVAEARYVYRQRDVDALVEVARRHLGRPLNEEEQRSAEQAIVALLPARESLLEAALLLPDDFTPQVRDRLLLDILDFEAEPSAALRREAGDDTAPAPSASDDGPALVQLPVLRRRRRFPDTGAIELVLGIALQFPSTTAARDLEAQAPIIQDAILGYIDGLDAPAFTRPTQAALKAGLASAIRARLDSFPTDGILITRIETAAVPREDE